MTRSIWRSARFRLPPDRSASDRGGAPRWIALVRARHWGHFLVLPLAGVSDGPAVSMLLAAVTGMVVAAGVLSFGYLLNGISDRHGDRDAAKNPFVDSAVDVRSLLRVAAILAGVTLLLAAWTSWTAFLSALVCLVSGTAYSVGPRLKARPVVGTLVNVPCFAPLLAVARSGPPPHGFVTLVAVFVALLVQNQLVHEAADGDEDRLAGSRTTFLAVGPRVTAALTLVVGATVPAALVLHHTPRTDLLAVLSCASLGLAVPLAMAVAGSRPTTMARVRHAHRWTSVVIGAALFVATRLAG